MYRNKRWLLLTSLVMIVSLLASACGAPATPPPPADTPAPPPVETAAPPEPAATPFAAPEVAMSYTFKIQEGVTFHKGGTLEPHDLAYSMWRGMLQDRSGGPQWMILEPLVGYSAIDDLAEEVGDVAACEAVKAAVDYDDDAGTVTFNLVMKYPWMEIMAQPFAAVMDMEWMAEQGAWDGDCATWRDWQDPEAEESVLFDQMNGTGPYVLEYWNPGEEISFVRNDNYWRTEQNLPIWEGGPTAPAIERLVIKLVDEWSTRLAMFEAGDCDGLDVPREYIAQVEPMVNEWYVGGAMDPDNLTVVNPNGTVRLFTNLPQVQSVDTFFNWNVNVEGGNPFVGTGDWTNGIPPDFFSDEHVRKAFNYCFDWETFIEDIYQGEAVQRRGPIIEGMFGFNPDQEIFTYDLDKCAEEFKLAWDGEVWEKGFYLTYVYNSGNTTRRAAGEIFEANVESVNDKFSVSVVDMPWPAYLKQMVDSRLTMFTIGWMEDFHHPHNWVHPYMHSAGAFAGFAGWPEDMVAEFDAKVGECVALSGDDQEQCYFDLQAMTYDNVTNVFIAQPVGRHYEQMWMEGWYYNPSYFGVFPFGQVTAKTGGDPNFKVYCTIGEPETLDPNWHYDTASAEAIWQAYENPVFFLRERVDAFVPALATEWEIE